MNLLLTDGETFLPTDQYYCAVRCQWRDITPSEFVGLPPYYDANGWLGKLVFRHAPTNPFRISCDIEAPSAGGAIQRAIDAGFKCVIEE